MKTHTNFKNSSESSIRISVLASMGWFSCHRGLSEKCSESQAVFGTILPQALWRGLLERLVSDLKKASRIYFIYFSPPPPKKKLETISDHKKYWSDFSKPSIKFFPSRDTFPLIKITLIIVLSLQWVWALLPPGRISTRPFYSMLPTGQIDDVSL